MPSKHKKRTKQRSRRQAAASKPDCHDPSPPLEPENVPSNVPTEVHIAEFTLFYQKIKELLRGPGGL
jgi:hypothetical protein